MLAERGECGEDGASGAIKDRLLSGMEKYVGFTFANEDRTVTSTKVRVKGLTFNVGKESSDSEADGVGKELLCERDLQALYPLYRQYRGICPG